MGADRSKNTYRGLLVPDPRIAHGSLSSDSVYTEAESRAGVPVPSSNPRSAMVLQATGEQEAGSTVEVLAQRGGFPGPRGAAGGFVYRNGSSGDYLGWDVPNATADLEWLQEDTDTADQAHVLRLQSGDGLAVMRYTDAVGVLDGLRVMTFDAEAGSWSVTATVQPDAWDILPIAAAHPCLVQLPCGRVHLYYWVTEGDSAQVQMAYSDDDGVSWSVGSRVCLSDGPVDRATYNLGKLRAAYAAGQVCLVAELTLISGPALKVQQYGSADGGLSFATMTAALLDGSSPEVLPRLNGGFNVMYVDTGVTPRVRQRPISNAFHDVSTVTEETPNADLDGDTRESMCAWLGEDGAWYFAATIDAVTATTNAVTAVSYSVDEGVTWRNLSDSAGNVGTGPFAPGDSNSFLRDYAAAEIRGRTVFLTSVTAAGATFDSYGLLCLYLGGYTNASRPSNSRFRGPADQAGQVWSWLPIVLPSDQLAWDVNTIGSPTITLDGDGLTLTGDVSSLVNYTFRAVPPVLDGTPQAPQSVSGERVTDVVGQVLSGGSETARALCLIVRLANGTNDYEVAVHFYAAGAGPGADAGYRVTDPHSGAAGTDVVFDVESRFMMRVAISEGRVRVWHRAAPTPGAVRGDWVEGYSGVLVSDTTTPETYSEPAAFGQFAVGEHSMRWLAVGTDAFSDFEGPSVSWANPDDLFPRPFSAFPTSLDSGMRVAAVDGPAVEGESWSIAARSLFGVELVDPGIAPSPRQQWRAAAETEQALVWDLDALADSWLVGSGPFGIAILNANWRTATLYGVPASGADVELIACDLRRDAGLSYSRNGRVIVPAGGTTDAAHWYQQNELEGATVVLDGTDRLRVQTNSQGWWTDAANVQTPSLYVPDVAGTEGTSGTLDLWMPSAVFVLREPPSPGVWKQLKLVIDAQTTRDGQLRTGVIMIGPLELFGRENSWGRIQRSSPNAALTTRRGGTRYARRLGPTRRVAELGWQDGIDTRFIQGTPDPDYVLFGTASPNVAGTPAATPHLLRGLLEQLDGPVTPVVHLAALDGTADGVVSEHRRDGLLYGRVTSNVRLESVQGDELADEIVRGGQLIIEEEV